ncbi:flagella basal body P-ring formation protein FlgA [Sphingomonas solaris]|uniref:Flagella basal body P-ring formation protein FlgA n=1 Tax=Alterirhizorhabdus solaris TaxID=2529389 RepID=A0A558QR64_9SPHN|nr:flagella basal body P-ring formation protein FlgA [Sphingomonas solaris]TVV69630.1 flagella basal body P-ring formation protein FlgA [Sphingomonas solaris]
MNPTKILLLALALLPAPALAAGLQNLDALERRLVIALGADIGAPGGPTVSLDRRLKLAACPGEVVIDPPALGAATLRCAEIGWRIRVPLVRGGSEGGRAMPASGNALPPARQPMREAAVVRRGDPLDLIAGDSGFSVSTLVIAEQDGAPGDRIRVRGDRAKPPIMAEVVAAGTVRLP